MTLEFWITPFDYAGCDGPAGEQIIGLSWAVLDYDIWRCNGAGGFRDFVVTLYVEGPEGKSRRAKVWDVSLR